MKKYYKNNCEFHEILTKSEPDLGLAKLVVTTLTSFSFTINTKFKLNSLFALNRWSLVSSATAEINVSVHGLCERWKQAFTEN